MKGIVVFSFGLREEASEPNPCNVRLGKAAERIIAAEREAVIVSQWEVSRYLCAIGCEPQLTVNLREDGAYLDSEGVWAEARHLFDELGITEVMPVAQPFLQMRKVRKMIAASGFTVVMRPIGWIGFDGQSSQWWTRGPASLILYAIRQMFLGARGHGGQQDAT